MATIVQELSCEPKSNLVSYTTKGCITKYKILGWTIENKNEAANVQPNFFQKN